MTDLEKSVLCVDYGNKGEYFASGSSDGCLRVMSVGKI